MRVRFWGVRGSVPWATAGSIGYGCNTPCVEIVDELSDRRLILDAGSGIVGVGATLDGIMHIPIVLTHYHWDHVQGLPFFAPLYRPGCAVTVWAPALGRQFADIETMFESPFFPVPYDRLPSRPAIRMYGAGTRGDQRVRRIHAPAESSGRSVRVSNQRRQRRSCVCDRSRVRQRGHDLALAHFSRGARVLILDSHFTPEEIPAHKGWGHSDWSQSAQFAASCGAQQLRLFHHKPGRPDDEMKEIERAAQRIFAETRAAKEGDSFLV